MRDNTSVTDDVETLQRQETENIDTANWEDVEIAHILFQKLFNNEPYETNEIAWIMLAFLGFVSQIALKDRLIVNGSGISFNDSMSSLRSSSLL